MLLTGWLARSLFLAIFLALCPPTEGLVPPSQRQSWAFREILRRAKVAQLSGDDARAAHFWKRARVRFSRKFPLPRVIPRANRPSPPMQGKALISGSAGLPYSVAKPMLEGFLRRFPGDCEVRLHYLRLARSNSDTHQIGRHAGILNLPSGSAPLWKLILLAFLAGLLASQVDALRKDLSGLGSTPPGGHSSKVPITPGAGPHDGENEPRAPGWRTSGGPHREEFRAGLPPVDPPREISCWTSMIGRGCSAFSLLVRDLVRMTIEHWAQRRAGLLVRKVP